MVAIENELHDAHVLNYEQFWQDGHVLIYRLHVARRAKLQDMLTQFSTDEYRDAVANSEAAFRQLKAAEEELSECERTKAKAPETGDIEKVLAARAAVAEAAQTLRSAEVNIQSLRGDFYRNLQPPTIATVQAALPPSEQMPWHLMAEPDELINAFGLHTGMSDAWFKKLADKPELMSARGHLGKKGRGGYAPKFHVYPVMLWLINPRRKTGKPMQEATGWRILKNRFPKVYEAFQDSAPDIT